MKTDLSPASLSPALHTLQNILAHKDPQQLASLLQGLLTPREITEIANRIAIVQMLRAHTPQREIAQRLGVGLATVSRGARAWQEGHFRELETLLDHQDQTSPQST
jgi:TrpR family trp operon transcriptional repressor